MTAIEFREKRLREIQEILEKLSLLESARCSAAMKDHLFRRYQRQIERLTAILNCAALERLCSNSG